MEAATQTASKFTVTLKMAAAPRVSTPPIWYVLSVVLDFLMMIVIAVFFNTLFINITVYFLGYFTKGRTSITRNLLAPEFSSWQSKSISHCLVSIIVH